MKFCDKLANLRKSNNLSQEQLAEKLNISRQSISKWESGDTYPDMAKLIQLCEVLNCKLPDLMDDGTFDENYIQKETDKSGFSSYLKNFLDYITKTYNMFIHMSFKSKLVCLIEMLIIGGVITLIVGAFPELVNGVLDRVFRHVPYGYTISSVITDIFTVVLAILGVISFFHLFKIRYLDYYVTITDNTIESQVVEEPIEENKENSVFNEKPKKEKMVIRDPKHSISHFLDGIGKVLLFFVKLFVIMCAIPALVAAVGGTYLAVIMICNVAFSSLFVFGSIALAGVAIIGFVLVFMAFNYLFKRKQPYTALITITICSLLAIGIGCGLATNKALEFDVVDENYRTNDKYDIETINILEENLSKNTVLDISTYEKNIDVQIDDNQKGIKIIIEKPDYVTVYTDEFVDETNLDTGRTISNGRYIAFSSNQNMGRVFNDIKEDIKNGYFRQSYDNPCELVKVKLIMSQETKDKIEIISWN